MHTLRLGLLTLFLAMVLLGSGPGPVAAEEAVAAPEGVMGALVRRFAADEDSLRAFYSEPLSELRLERLRSHAMGWTSALGALDVEAMGADDRVDYVLLRNHLERRVDELDLQADRNRSTQMILGSATALLELDRTRWRPTKAPDGRRLAASLVAVTKRLAAARVVVEAVHEGVHEPTPTIPLTPVTAFRAAKALERLGGVLKRWYAFHDGYDPGFAWWCKKPYDELVKALTRYAKFLRTKVAGIKEEGAAPLIGDPIGEAALRRSLAREMIPYSPEELLTIAQQEFDWCQAEGAKAAKELEVADWAAAVAKVKRRHQPPGGQAAMVVKQGTDAVAFLEARELVTVPPLCAETWRLRMISQRSQKTLPFAVYHNQHMLVAYAMSGMAHESKLMSMRGNNEHFTRIVTPHELIPGHHLQLFQAARHRAHRAIFRTPFFVEGWALHWEMLLWDLGWQRGAADKVGMLFWRMHRCARIIVTLRFHLGTMQPADMIDFLAERVGLERDGATSEVRRYIAGAYGPLYQCAYMLGGLQMRALHHELVGNGRMSNQEFHDAVLRQGSIPIELVRAALTGQTLERNHAASWRWRGEVKAGPRPR